MIKPRSGIGQLRSRIELFKITREPDEDFGFDEELESLGKVWADAVEGSPTAYLDGATNDQPAATHQFRVRRKPGLDLLDVRTIVVWEKRRYQLMRTRREDQRGDYMILFCTAQQKTP